MAIESPPRPGLPEAPPPRGRISRRWSWVAALVVALAAVVVVAAVTWPSGGRVTTAPPPAPPTEQEKQAVADAWLSFVRTAVAVNNPPDPARAAEVRAFATGPAYDSVVRAISDNQRKGVATRLPPNSRSGEKKIDVVSIDGDTAILRSCGVDDGRLVEMATGRVLNDRVVTTLYTVFLVREEGRWKVENNRVEQKWEGVSGCAAA